jgi:hypothetical protein
MAENAKEENMLVAAMILGLVGGISYFVGGGAGAIYWAEGSTPWWVIALIPIGAVGAIGGAMARANPGIAGSVMLLAGAAAIAVGFASYEDAFQARTFLSNLPSIPAHAFVGPLIYLPAPLLSLIVGGALALSAQKR